VKFDIGLNEIRQDKQNMKNSFVSLAGADLDSQYQCGKKFRQIIK